MQKQYTRKKPLVHNGREPSEVVKYMKTLTPEQEKVAALFVEGGKNKHQIAKELGTSAASVTRTLNQDHVSYEVAKRREDMRIKMKMTREDVAQVFIDAIEMARVMAEPSTMIQGGREVGKMLGYYEPETVKIEISNNVQELQQQLRTLTDAELYELMNEHAVEGEFKELPSDPAS